MTDDHAMAWHDYETDYSKLGKTVGRAKAVRKKCLDCMCQNAAEVLRCDIVTCPLWFYRMGKPWDSYQKAAKKAVPPENRGISESTDQSGTQVPVAQ